MNATLKNNRNILLEKLTPADYPALSEYLLQLSPETKSRFGPHPFDFISLVHFYTTTENLTGYISRDTVTGLIIAYSIVQTGCLPHDILRLQSFGFNPDPVTDCTFAPSVADAWQGMGIGHQLFKYIVNDLKNRQMKRIVLWGGVQCENKKAVMYYLRNGFRILGEFEYNGRNYDMVMVIS